MSTGMDTRARNVLWHSGALSALLLVGPGGTAQGCRVPVSLSACLRKT
jgi:hypothetical protein